MKNRVPLISIVVPVFNEEENVVRAYEAIHRELAGRSDLNFEIIFTDNHSTDATFERLKQLAARDRNVKVLRFARNFGFNRSILTGYRCAQGDAAIQIDCDLEDPPHVFHDFIRLWQAGHDVVTGIRLQRSERKRTRVARKAFYRLLNRISDVRHEPDAGDFRLVDRSILDQLRAIEDAQPYVRGLVTELACNEAWVEYARNSREFGRSKFPFLQLVRLGMDGIYAHSTVPLRVATFAGIAIALATAGVTAFYILGRLFAEEPWPPGFTTTIVLILFGISLNALFLGIIGEYIARIYRIVRTRPTVVVESAINTHDALGPMYRQRVPSWPRDSEGARQSKEGSLLP